MKKHTIAIIAHDNKKADMIQFLIKNGLTLKHERVKLIATGLLGRNAEKSGFKIKKMLPCSMGGDAQIASKVAEGRINAVFFFKDPLANHAHEVDVNMLLRICDVHNVPLATNEATAQLMLNAIVQQL
ncbi:methylglyoxal synthase [Flavobacterium sp. Leaf82]|jgi:methylglyoxal synthase|uniref:methylglyoxal synthase n=1 Tax=unclassified Flavobacterium TaxID=196869 RepID=UPI0007018264|nr:methylglyoxal synthase [Flavobacterium sp. Leaf82]KQO24828.1 methylglyoxal synthase [Flavobacterium sp. Leaf82]